MNPSKLLIGIITFVLVSCTEEPTIIDYTGFTERNFTIAGLDSNFESTDTLAEIRIKLPERLDTFYKWRHYSCCTNCDNTKYRFADKRYPQFAESGFYWTVEPDSVYQFSIWHKPLRFFSDSTQLEELTINDSGYFYNNIPRQFSLGDKLQPIKKSFQKINGRNFFIVQFISPFGYLTRKETYYVVAGTNLKDRQIKFIGECSAKDSSQFFIGMYKSIQSIVIKERTSELVLKND